MRFLRYIVLIILLCLYVKATIQKTDFDKSKKLFCELHSIESFELSLLMAKDPKLSSIQQKLLFTRPGPGLSFFNITISKVCWKITSISYSYYNFVMQLKAHYYLWIIWSSLYSLYTIRVLLVHVWTRVVARVLDLGGPKRKWAGNI